MIFGEYSDVVEIDTFTMQRFLDISRFGGLAGMLTCLRIVHIEGNKNLKITL